MAVCYENCGLYKIDITLFKEDYLNKKLDINKLEEYAKCVTNNTTESPLGSIFYIKNNLQHYVKEYKEHLTRDKLANLIKDLEDMYIATTASAAWHSPTRDDLNKQARKYNSFLHKRLDINNWMYYYIVDYYSTGDKAKLTLSKIEHEFLLRQYDK